MADYALLMKIVPTCLVALAAIGLVFVSRGEAPEHQRVMRLGGLWSLIVRPDGRMRKGAKAAIFFWLAVAVVLIWVDW